MLVSPVSFIILIMIRRVAAFFFIVGLIAILISFGSAQQNAQTIQISCFGFAMIILGVFIWFRNREKPKAERFRLISKLTNRKKR